MHIPSITLVGLGPRGLSLLERIAAYAHARPGRLRLDLVEPNGLGPGVHDPRQPDWLLINTLASQVSAFPAAGTVRLPPVCATPTLTEWASAQAGGAGLPDYLPRSLLGRYLAWATQAVLDAMPRWVEVRHVRQRALDLVAHGPTQRLLCEDGSLIASDYLFIATGHPRACLNAEERQLDKFAQARGLTYVRHPYPLAQLDAIAPASTVAVQGLGLTGHDVVAALTAGRGGRFVRSGARLVYQPSGREPRLVLFSRNSMPACARALNEKGLTGRHAFTVFTPAAIEGLRQRAVRRNGSPQLDFEADLLPLLYQEMTLAAERADPRPELPLALREASMADPAARRRMLDALWFPLHGRAFDSSAAFAAFIDDWLRGDLEQARLGNRTSPVKAAADVLRDARGVLQQAIEHGGLTPASHRAFMQVYNPAINRFTFGPPLQRNEEWLALLEAGVLRIAGPHARIGADENCGRFQLTVSPGGRCETYASADALVVARVDVASPETDDSPFMQRLRQRGLVKPFANGAYHPGGVAIDADNHPLRRDGQPHPRLWVLGYPAEGAHYYTHALPRAGLPSRQVQDADRCISELFGMLEHEPGFSGRPRTAGQGHALRTGYGNP